MRDGRYGTLISTGAALAMSTKAAEELSVLGISVSVLSMPTLSPLDQDAILRAAKDTGKLVTIEDHGIGGLGTMVAEVLVRAAMRCRFLPMYFEAQPAVFAGSQAEMYVVHRLTASEILANVLAIQEP